MVNFLLAPDNLVPCVPIFEGSSATQIGNKDINVLRWHLPSPMHLLKMNMLLAICVNEYRVKCGTIFPSMKELMVIIKHETADKPTLHMYFIDSVRASILERCNRYGLLIEDCRGIKAYMVDRKKYVSSIKINCNDLIE